MPEINQRIRDRDEAELRFAAHPVLPEFGQTFTTNISPSARVVGKSVETIPQSAGSHSVAADSLRNFHLRSAERGRRR